MTLRNHALLLAAGASVALCSVLLACDGDTSTDAGIDGAVDGTTEDVAAPDTGVPDADMDAVAPDASPGDAASDGNAGDAAPDAADAAVDGGPAAMCTSTGGTVTTAQCCKNTNDFPSTCATGPCGCSPQNSHTVQTCQCPSNQCYTQQLGCH